MFKVNKKWWLVYPIIALISLGLGITFLPVVTDIGLKLINFILAGIMLVYVVVFCSFRFSKQSSKITKISGLIELSINLTLVILFILGGLDMIKFSIEAAKLLGIVLLIRGVIQLIVKYFVTTKINMIFGIIS